MTAKEKRWLKMLNVWHSIQEDPKYTDLSLWDRVVIMAQKVNMTPHGVRKFLIRQGEYELIISIS